MASFGILFFMSTLLICSEIHAQLTRTMPPPPVTNPPRLTGGLGSTRPGDASAQAIADKVKGQVQRALGKTFTTYRVSSYRTQVVAGTNYYMKVYIEDNQGAKYVAHLRIFESLDNTIKLNGGMFPTNWNDPIEFSGYTSLN